MEQKAREVGVEFREWFAQQLKDVMPERAKLLRECEGNIKDAFHAGVIAAKSGWVK